MGERSSKKFLVITYWDFNEAHVQANVLPNLRILSKVSDADIYLFCLNKRPLTPEEERRVSAELATHRIHLLWFHYSHFGLKMMLKFLWLIPYLCITVLRKKISRIYAWCTTAGAIGYLVSKLAGRPLVLESYEPHAEAMVENGYWTTKRFPYRVLSWFEKKQAQRAWFIIAANSGMPSYVQKRYNYNIPKEKIYAKPACVDLNQFEPDEKVRMEVRKTLNYSPENIVCLYAGKFGGIYLEEETFELLKTCYDQWGDLFRVLLLTSQDEGYIRKHCERVGLHFEIFTIRFVPHQEVPLMMQAADFAICPVKPVPTKRFCTPVKNGEYWALGLPVIITAGISDDSDIIEQNGTGAVIGSLDEKGYKEAVSKMAGLLRENRREFSEKIRSIAFQYRNYDIASTIYKDIERKFKT
jgi:glycosyltransferase involved in cell wall biosynthesis